MRTSSLSFIAVVACWVVACVGGSGPPRTNGQRHSSGSPQALTCGNGVCEPGESHASCPNDCCAISASWGDGGVPSGDLPPDGGGGGSGGGGGGDAGLDPQAGCLAQCGNGFCDGNEDHDTCPSDCCAQGPDGYCLAECGNGFCELGETHTTCKEDCCEMTADGACASACGNGFCEAGEDHGSCPADCCATNPDGSCSP